MTSDGTSYPPPPPTSYSGAGAPAPEPAKPWWKKWWAIALGVFVVLIVIAAIAGGGKKKSDSSSESTPTQTDAPPATENVQSTDSAPEATDPPDTTVAPETIPPPPTLPGFSGGIVLVGSDVAPGIYQTIVPGDSFGCYWERLSDLSGDFQAIITNANVASGAQAIVEIVATDEAFSSNTCGEWSLYAPPPSPANAFGEGTWIVGQQFVAGRYRSTGDADSFGCYWERLSGVSGGFDHIIANDNVEGSAIVDIAASDFAFNSSGCGDWTLV